MWEVSFCIAVAILATAIVFYRHVDGYQIAIFVGLLALAVCLVAAFPRSESVRELGTSGPRQVAQDGFTGSQTCQSCHPGEHASWHRSFHRTMTEQAVPEAIKAPWSGHLDLDGVRYRLFRKGEEHWVATPDPDADFRLRNQGQSVVSTDLPMVERRIVMTTGSHHMQMYWMASERYETELRLFPWIYQIREQRWLPYEHSFVVSSDMPRPGVLWNENCIACHSLKGAPGFNFLSNKFSSSVTELGISCEACHGPGKRHVAKYRSPLTRYAGRGKDKHESFIVNPDKLSSKQQTQICGQCHSTFTFHDTDGRMDRRRMSDFMKHGFDYRAGEDVRASRNFLLHGRGTPGEDIYYWKDGTSRIGGREYLGLIRTGCYQRGEMSCLSCHSMHSADPDDQIKPQMRGSQACLQCHQEMADKVTEHTHHEADSAGSNCYNCHMPKTSYALLGAIRSHRVDSPSVEVSMRSGKPNACNLCHMDKSMKWTAEQLEKWYSQSTPPELLQQVQQTSAWVDWLLKGDAAQRVIAAANARFEPPRAACGADWQAPLLAQLLTDDYAALRFVAFHALREYPGLQDIDYERLATPESRLALQNEIVRQWEMQDRIGDPLRLQTKDGKLDRVRLQQLLQSRDKTSIQLIE